MTSLHSALKSEIARVARKEMKEEIVALRKVTSSHRAEIAMLKRDLKSLRSLIKSNVRFIKKVVPAPLSPPDAPPTRTIGFNALALAKKRADLGLSQAAMAKLLDASSLSVYKWESGRVQPRAAQLAKIASIQKIGKREAAARLAK